MAGTCSVTGAIQTLLVLSFVCACRTADINIRIGVVDTLSSDTGELSWDSAKLALALQEGAGEDYGLELKTGVTVEVELLPYDAYSSKDVANSLVSSISEETFLVAPSDSDVTVASVLATLDQSRVIVHGTDMWVEEGDGWSEKDWSKVFGVGIPYSSLLRNTFSELKDAGASKVSLVCMDTSPTYLRDQVREQAKSYGLSMTTTTYSTTGDILANAEAAGRSAGNDVVVHCGGYNSPNGWAAEKSFWEGVKQSSAKAAIFVGPHHGVYSDMEYEFLDPNGLMVVVQWNPEFIRDDSAALLSGQTYLSESPQVSSEGAVAAAAVLTVLAGVESSCALCVSGDKACFEACLNHAAVAEALSSSNMGRSTLVGSIDFQWSEGRGWESTNFLPQTLQVKKGEAHVVWMNGISDLVIDYPVALGEDDGAEIKIGSAISQSGSFIVEGISLMRGYALWQEKVNSVGGLLVGSTRKKVKFVFYDDYSNKGISSLLVKRLIEEDGCEFLLGPYSSGITTETSAVANDLNVVMVQGGGASESAFSVEKSQTFGVLTTATLYAKSGIEAISAQVGANGTVAVYYKRSAFTNSTAEGALIWCEEYGLNVVHENSFAAGSSEDVILEDLARIQSYEPDLFVACGHLADSIQIIGLMKSLNFSPKAVLITAGIGSSLITQLGQDANFVSGSLQWTVDLSDSFKDDVFGTAADFSTMYLERYGPEKFNPWVAQGGAAALVLGMGIEESCKGCSGASCDTCLGTASVSDAIRALEVNTFFGSIKFDQLGKNTGKPMVTGQVQDGVLKIIAPDSAANADIQYPMTSWEERFVVSVGAAVSAQGLFEVEGMSYRRAYQLWAKVMNDNFGGINIGGKPFKIMLTMYDDESDKVKSAELVEKLIVEDRVEYLLGPYSSGITSAVSAVSEAYNVTMVQGGGASETLFEKGYQHLFGVLTTGQFYSQSGMELINQTYEGTDRPTVVVYHKSSAFTNSTSLGAQRWAKEYGMDLLLVKTYSASITEEEMRVDLIEIQSLQPYVLVACGHLQDTMTLVRIIKELDFTPPALLATGGMGRSFIAGLGQDANFVHGSMQWSENLDDAFHDPVFGTAGDFYNLFVEEYGSPDDFNVWVANGGAAALTLGFAIETSCFECTALDCISCRSSQSVGDALRAMKVNTFFGPIDLDESGKNAGKPMVTGQVQYGEIALVAPPSAANSPTLVPTPDWLERFTLQVGFTASLTGPFAREGEWLRRGYQLWAEEINRLHGGILVGDKYHHIELKFYDDESDLERVTALTNKLILEDNIHFLLAPYSYPFIAEASQIAEDNNAIMVEATSSEDGLFTRGLKNLFSPRLAASKSIRSSLLAARFSGARTLAILASAESHYALIAEGVQNDAKETDVQVVGAFQYEEFDLVANPVDDLNDPVDKIMKLRPDILLFAASKEDTIELIRHLDSLEYTPKSMLTLHSTNADFLSELGYLSYCKMSPALWHKDLSYRDPILGGASNITQAYTRLFGAPEVPTVTGLAVSAALTLQLGIEKSCASCDVYCDHRVCMSTASVSESLSTLEAETFFGELDLRSGSSSSGALTLHGSNAVDVVPVVQMQLLSGGREELVLVAPSQVARHPVHYPCHACPFVQQSYESGNRNQIAFVVGVGGVLTLAFVTWFLAFRDKGRAKERHIQQANWRAVPLPRDGVLLYGAILFEFAQLSALAISASNIGTGDGDGLSKYIRMFLLAFVFDIGSKETFPVIFWIAFGLVCGLLVSVGIVNYKVARGTSTLHSIEKVCSNYEGAETKTKKKKGGKEGAVPLMYLAIPGLSIPTFVPVLRTMSKTFSCTYTEGETVYWDLDCTVECWEGIHKTYAIVSIISICCMYPVVVCSQQLIQRILGQRRGAPPYYDYRFKLIQHQVKGLNAIVSGAFIADTLWVMQVSSLFLAALILLVVNTPHWWRSRVTPEALRSFMFLGPCSVEVMNLLRTITLSAVLWCCLCSFLSHVPELEGEAADWTFILGWIVILIFANRLVKRFAQKDMERLEEDREAAAVDIVKDTVAHWSRSVSSRKLRGVQAPASKRGKDQFLTTNISEPLEQTTGREIHRRFREYQKLVKDNHRAVGGKMLVLLCEKHLKHHNGIHAFRKLRNEPESSSSAPANPKSPLAADNLSRLGTLRAPTSSWGLSRSEPGQASSQGSMGLYDLPVKPSSFDTGSSNIKRGEPTQKDGSSKQGSSKGVSKQSFGSGVIVSEYRMSFQKAYLEIKVTLIDTGQSFRDIPVETMHEMAIAEGVNPDEWHKFVYLTLTQ